MIRHLSALIVLISWAAAGCSGTPQAPADPVVATVQMEPDSLTLQVGETRPLTAVPRTAAGQLVSGAAVMWASTAAGVAGVSQQGQVTGLAPGTAEITATVAGHIGRAFVRVLQGGVASLRIPGDSVRTLERGEGVQLEAIIRDAGGSAVAGVEPVWETSDEAVASVSPTGSVLAGRGGSALVTARAGGQSASVRIRVPAVQRVEVLPQGDSIDPAGTLQLTATVHTEAGVRTVPLQWVGENDEIAVVDAQGRVTALRAGTAVLRATAEGVAGRTLVTVRGVRAPLRLESADDEPLPASLHETEWTDERGVTRLARVVLVSGSLELREGRYTSRLEVQLTDAEGVREVRVHEDSGTVVGDQEELVLRSERTEGLEVGGVWEWRDGFPTGKLTLTQRVGADGPPVPLRFRP